MLSSNYLYTHPPQINFFLVCFMQVTSVSSGAGKNVLMRYQLSLNIVVPSGKRGRVAVQIGVAGGGMREVGVGERRGKGLEGLGGWLRGGRGKGWG